MGSVGFLQARDFLLRNHLDYQAAYEGFEWPRLDEFNWALDYFDPMAKENHRPALRVLNEFGAETFRTFAELSAQSNQVANYLRRIGVRRGDRILVMLANEIPLWQVMLAACKAGAVVVPASTLLSQDDLQDRLDRGGVGYVIVTPSQTWKFTGLSGSFCRLTTGPEHADWRSLDPATTESESFSPDARDASERSAAALFHIRHDCPA